MKRAIPLFAAIVILAACSSSAPDLLKPEIELVQLYAPTDLGYARGQNTLMAQFGFRITNRSSEPITLKRVSLQSSGEGGYALRPEDKTYALPIGSGESAEEIIEARAYFLTTRSGSPSSEPVTLRATFYFDSPKGTFRQIVQRNIAQMSSGPR